MRIRPAFGYNRIRQFQSLVLLLIIGSPGSPVGVSLCGFDCVVACTRAPGARDTELRESVERYLTSSPSSSSSRTCGRGSCGSSGCCRSRTLLTGGHYRSSALISTRDVRRANARKTEGAHTFLPQHLRRRRRRQGPGECG